MDVILDTDTYNEIDDQFALAYLIKNEETFNLRGIFIAPFYNEKVTSIKEGIKLSHKEVIKILSLLNKQEYESLIYDGASSYLTSNNKAIISDATNRLIELSKEYSKDNPLTIIAIGCITNIASAIILDPSIVNRIRIVWLGGNSFTYSNNKEFNLMQDVYASRIIFESNAPLVQLPCGGVVEEFYIDLPSLEKELSNSKNKLSEYLITNTISYMQEHKLKIKQIWDVTAVAYLLNKNLMEEEIKYRPTLNDDCSYIFNQNKLTMHYVSKIHSKELFVDLFYKLNH